MTARCRYPCPNKPSKRGLCDTCYHRAKREGELHLFPAAGPPERLWPIGPLLRLARLNAGQLLALAAEVGAHETTVRRAAADGLTDQQADHWAVALGTVPTLVWGEEWDRHGLTERDDRFVNGPGLGWRRAWEWAEACEPTALPQHSAGELGEAA